MGGPAGELAGVKSARVPTGSFLLSALPLCTPYVCRCACMRPDAESARTAKNKARALLSSSALVASGALARGAAPDEVSDQGIWLQSEFRTGTNTKKTGLNQGQRKCV